MKCLVTAGPTYEPLDKVRRLTNMSTGKLGSQLASFLSSHGHEVMLLLGEQSTWRGPVKAQSVVSFSTTADLRKRLEDASKNGFDAVFHAAAVSDFAFGKIWQRGKTGELVEIKSNKVPSDRQNLVVELKPTPKIIAELRGWFPSSFLVGWKFEVEGNRESVLAKARKQIEDNRTDASVANGPAYGDGFGLVNASGAVRHVESSEALFGEIEKLLKLQVPSSKFQRSSKS